MRVEFYNPSGRVGCLFTSGDGIGVEPEDNLKLVELTSEPLWDPDSGTMVGDDQPERFLGLMLQTYNGPYFWAQEEKGDGDTPGQTRADVQ